MHRKGLKPQLYIQHHRAAKYIEIHIQVSAKITSHSQLFVVSPQSREGGEGLEDGYIRSLTSH